MSLINDALKTAQRERSGQVASGSGDQPLLEGFFPYVSTGAPRKGPSRLRIAGISTAAVVTLAVAGWLVLPTFKASPSKAPSIVLAPRHAATPKIVQQTQTPEPPTTARAVAARADSDKAQVLPSPAQLQPTRRERQQRVASAPEGQRDTVVARPDEPLAGVPERRATPPNYEADAVVAFNVGDYTTAKARFEAAIRSAPTASAYTNYGVTLEKLGDWQGAARAYQSAIGIDAGYFNAWLYRARVYNLMGDTPRAIPLFMRALEIRPTDSDVNADLAELEFRDGAFAEARRYADVAAKSNPGNPRAHYYLALASDTLKDRDTARRAFEDYLRTIAGQEKDNDASIGYARTRLQELKGKP
jgi:tetratricopeptide (TPR) repeat protein